jgi:hypothetical protein
MFGAPCPVVRIFLECGNNWQRQAITGLFQSRGKAVKASLQAESGGMAERFKAPVLKTGDP